MPWWLAASLGAVAGAALGSFAANLADRLPRGESVRDRCVCRGCGRPVGAWNLPVVGWLALRGRARCCGVRLPVWWWGFEVAGAAAVAAGAGTAGWDGAVGAGAVVVACGFVVAWWAERRGRLPGSDPGVR